MASTAKNGVQDLGQVRIPSKTLNLLHALAGTIETRVRIAAAVAAQARDIGKGPGIITADDVLHAGLAVLPTVLHEIELALQLNRKHARKAS